MSKHFLTGVLAVLGVVVLSSPAVAADDGRGAELFELCVQCHGEAGEGSQLALAPGIAGQAEWYVARQLRNFRSGVRGLHPDDVGGLRMHPMSRALKDDEEIEILAAYVANLPPAQAKPTVEGGDASRGEPLYSLCATCHGPAGAGIETMSAPRLTGQGDWYLVSSIEKYKAGIRGANQQNPNGALMRGMVNQLPDQQAIKDVVAYIETLPR